MSLIIIRIVFLLLSGIAGYEAGTYLDGDMQTSLLSALGATGLAAAVIFLEQRLQKVSPKMIVGAVVGLFLSLVLANLLTYSLMLTPIANSKLNFILAATINLIAAYLGMILGAKKGEEFQLSEYRNIFRTPLSGENAKILDTSVIIDGRIADICETGFLEGVLIVPQFILKELQQIADSSDPLKRNRGRRGLEVLQRIQKNVEVQVQIIDQDFPQIRDVDAKLVALGKLLGGKVLTNDFNLNKVAELQGIPVLNINQLANAVKPVVLPGETMNVYLLKEGKEYGQGVAYLDDGTMVVVDNAKKYLGRTVEVAVTSVLQTTAGRMIFARLKEEIEREEGFQSSRVG